MSFSPTRAASTPAWIAGAIALAGLAATFTGAGPARARFLAAAAGLFFSTGYALVRVTPRRSWGDGPAALAYAFPASCVLLFVPLLAGELSGLGTTPLRLLARPYLAVAAFLLFREALRDRPRFAVARALPLIALAAGAFAAARGGLVTWPSDAPDHIAVIREIQATGETHPITSYYARSTDERLDARKGFLFGGAAVAATLAGADATDAYEGIPGLVAALFLVGFYALARESIGGAAAFLATAYAVLSWDGGLLGVWFGRSGSPFLFAAPLAWAAILVVLAAAKGRGIPALPAAVVGFALMGAHAYVAVTAVLLAGLCVVVLPFARGGRAHWWAAFVTLVLLGAGCVPIGVWRAVASYPPVDPIHTHLQGIVRIGEHLYTANPLLAFGRVSLFGILGIPLSLLLLPRARKDIGVLFAVALTLLPFLVMLNPVLVPLLVPFVGYLLGRITWYGGHFLVLGALVASWAGGIRGGAFPRRAAAIAALLVLHGVFATSLWARDAGDVRRRLTATPFRLADHPGPERWADLFRYMTDELPPRAVVAADPITGYLIPAFTPQKTVAILAQHSSTADPYAPQRLDDMVRALSPYVDGNETADILRRDGADYVLLNFRVDAPVISYMATIDPALYQPTLEKFRREPGRYHELWAADRCHLFAFDSEGPAGEGADRPVRSMTAAASPLEATPMDELYPNGVRLVGVSHAPDTLAPGEPLDVVCYWSRFLDTTDPLPYKVYLRLTRPGAGEGSSWWSKPARKLKEIVRGDRTRARTMRNLARGVYPTREWPRTGVVADSIQWTIPRDLEEGTYELQVQLRRSPFVQVYDLDDFLRETDSFSGVDAGPVRVIRSAGS